MNEWTVIEERTLHRRKVWWVIKGHIHVCECETQEQANQIAREHNSLGNVKELLSEIGFARKSYSDETIPLQFIEASDEAKLLLDELAKAEG